MNASRWAVAVLSIAVPVATWAQGNWPVRSIALVVPYAPGGPTDIVARTIAASMSKSLGQSVIVENKSGAGGTIGTGHVARSTPDGYTLIPFSELDPTMDSFFQVSSVGRVVVEVGDRAPR